MSVLAALTHDDASLALRQTEFEGIDTLTDPTTVSDALAAIADVAGTDALEHQSEIDGLVGDREAVPDVWTRASPSTYLGSGGSATPSDDGAGHAQSGDAADAGADGAQRGDGRDSHPRMLLRHGEEDAVVPPMASELS